MPAPFTPGDRILSLRHPRSSWVVVSCEPYPGSEAYRVHARQEPAPGLSAVDSFAPATSYQRAPANWRDAPTMPNGCAALGLSADAWDRKRDNDDADPLHQHRMRQWHSAMLTWCRDVLVHLYPAEAEREIAWHARRLGADAEAA